MKSVFALAALAVTTVALSTTAKAQIVFNADFNQSQDFTTGVGSTGWTGAYGGNNSLSVFDSNITNQGQLTISDTGGHWEFGSNTGHLLYESVTGNFTMTSELTSINNPQYSSAGIGAFDPSETTASPSNNWVGIGLLSFENTIDSRNVVNGGQSDVTAGNPGDDSGPLYFQMTRVGDVFTSYYSTTGLSNSWVDLGSVTDANLGNTLDLGIWAASYSGNTTTATFGSFSIETQAVPEPSTDALLLSGFFFLAWTARRKLTV